MMYCYNPQKMGVGGVNMSEVKGSKIMERSKCQGIHRLQVEHNNALAPCPSCPVLMVLQVQQRVLTEKFLLIKWNVISLCVFCF